MAATETSLFPWQEAGEIVHLWGRRHFFFLLLRLTIPALVLTVPIALWGSGADLLFIPLSFLILGPIAALLFLWFYLDWQDDYWAVTDRRLVKRSRTYLLYESREEVQLGRIQNIEVVWPGMLAQLLGYGDVGVRSAAGSILLSSIPQPDQVREGILSLAGTAPKDWARERREGEATVSESATSVEVRRPPFIEYFFPRLRVEEEGQVTWRKHWYVLVQKVAGALALFVLVAELAVGVALDLIPIPFLTKSTAMGLAGLVCGILALVIFYQYEDWRNDVYLLTLDRLVDIDKKPFRLREERREASLAMVQDVKYVIPGFLANLLNTGSVIIETAAKEGAFTFDWVHDPRSVQQEIFSALEAYRERQRAEEREARMAELKEIMDSNRRPGENDKPSGAS